MKKTLALILAIMMIAFAAAGCTESGGGYGDEDNTGSPTSGATPNSKPSSSPSANPAGSTGFDRERDITVISREEGSGTRGAFIELTGVEQKDENGEKVDKTTLDAQITNSTSVMMTAVAGNEYAIGYISLGSLNETVKAIAIDGVEANVENIKNGTYSLVRPFNIAAKEDISEAASDFIKFILSAEGQKVVEDSGYITLDGAKAYDGNKPSGKIVVAGSSSVTPVMEKLKEAYLQINPDVKIDIHQSDSTTGMTSAINGICDIGMASRDLKESELSSGLTATVIAQDGIAVIVNNDNPITGITVEQIRDIYIGTVTSWKGFAE